MRGSRLLFGWAAALCLVSACTVSTSPTASTSTEPSSSPSPSASAPAESTPSASPTSVPSTAAVAIAGLPVHNGEVGVGYLAVTLSAKDGTPPYTWTVGSGQLAPGLSLSPGGVITGTSSKAGSFAFVAKVTDSTGAAATGKATIAVFPAFAVSQPCARACNVAIGCNVCGGFGSYSGGAGPYTFKIVSGAPPPGMGWKALSVTGAFPAPPPPNLSTGPPPPAQPFTVQVTDGFSVSKTVTAYWNIFPAVNFVPDQSGGAPSGGCYSPGSGVCDNVSSGYPISYTLGNPSDNIAVVVLSACFDDPNANSVCSTDVGAQPLSYYLPPGWYATAKGGVVTVGMNCGNPDKCAAKTGGVRWYGDVIIVLVDKGACVAPSAKQSALQVDVNIDI